MKEPENAITSAESTLKKADPEMYTTARVGLLMTANPNSEKMNKKKKL